MIGERGVAEPLRGPAFGDLTPLVGRDEELELLLRRWQQAKAGEGRWCCSRASRGSASRA